MNSNSPEVRALVQAMADKLLQVSLDLADSLLLNLLKQLFYYSDIREEN